jgi:hypothetical protein
MLVAWRATIPGLPNHPKHESTLMPLFNSEPSTSITVTWPSHPIVRDQLRPPRRTPVVPIEPTRPAAPHWPLTAELDVLGNDFDRRHPDYVSAD